VEVKERPSRRETFMKKSATVTEKKNDEVDVRKHAATSPLESFPRMGFGEWFDHWPELFARRWPESLGGTPFGPDGFRMEQLVEDDGTMVVRGELPGLDPDADITITLESDRLTIGAQREERSEKTDSGSYRSEFHYGAFERSVRLPTGARVDDVTATYTDGILEVRVPIDEPTESVTKVPIVKKDRKKG
jgi:HSP20 family protein